MDITLGYAIAVGGVLLLFVLINLHPSIPYLIPFAPQLFYRTFRYLTYPYLVRRYRFLGPWTLADVIVQFIYIASNSVCLGFRVSGLGFRVASIAEAGMQAGILSLINMIPLFLGPHLSFLADILGVSLSTFRHIHRSAGLMSLGLVLFHTLVIVTSSTAFAPSGAKNLPGVIGGSSLGFIVVLSWPLLRRRFYEIFLRLHHILAVAIALSALLHVPSTLFPRLYFYIAFGIFIATSVAEGYLLLRYNGIFAYSKGMQAPRVGEIFKYPDGDDNSPVQMMIFLERPLKIKAGQYINIWIRSLGVWSFMQSHPFVVASWTGKQQENLELMIEPRRGWTKELHSRAITASGQNGGLGRVLFTGPHGAVVPVDEYEYLFMIASDYGIVAHLPLLERLVQGMLAREVRARRICLVWETEDRGLYNTVYPLFNWVLGEDGKLGDNCAVAISLYSRQLGPAKLSKRAQIFDHPIPLKDVFKAEIEEIDKRKIEENKAVEEMEMKRADEKERGRIEIMERRNVETIHKSGTLPVCTRTPRMLITVSASTKIRDELRSILQTSFDKKPTLDKASTSIKIWDGLRSIFQTSLDEKPTLVELDFQPSD